MLDQIKLSDFLSGQSLFTAIKNVNGVTFSFLTPENIPKLDNNLMFNYGDRILFNKMVNMDLNIIAESIVLNCGDNWKNLIDSEINKINPLAKDSKVIIESINNVENRTNENDTVNKVSAYNTDNLINNDGSTVNAIDNLTGDKTRNYKEENLSIENLFNNLSILQKTNIINIVLKDVSDFLTISVY